MINRFIIFGDSYSTHLNHIPRGYAHYYCDGGRAPDQPVTNMRMQQTWWGQMMERTGATLVRNDSWSGTTIGYTGYAGDCSTSSSFICRYRQLANQGFFAQNPVDTMFVFGGTNDSWSNAPLGEEQYADFCETDLFSVMPAICHFLTTLRQQHPDARIVCIANCDIKPEVVDCMRHAAERLDLEFVELHDVDKINGHPTVLGMTQICDQVLGALRE